ncbi:MAG: MFS transporter [Flavobacteriaceae bacterium]|nr:MFS transporter [Flavobacteriaceae bacterium]
MKPGNVKLGLKENWKQFSLLLIVNAFVGGMIGLERTILPKLAEIEFGILATSVILPFIIVFGITKALTNYFTGALANRLGRKKLLVVGWIIALPIPFILMYAQNWSWIIFANVLLGINQGLTWSTTVVMKIDLVGERQRGLAMGLNESFGYLAVALVAFTTGWIAAEYAIRPYPFYQGIAFVVLGLLLSWLFIHDTEHHVATEASTSDARKLIHVFLDTSWRDHNLGSITQAGFVNNLNDGMIWGIFPVILASKSFDLKTIGIIVAVYPAVWGIGQLFTGKLSDHLNKKAMLVFGMALQGLAIVLMYWAQSSMIYILLSIVLGLGTALVYPTFLAALAGFTHPQQRAESIGVFRLWRDLGYAVGALLTIVLTIFMETDKTLVAIGLLTVLSAFIIWIRMDK